MPYFQIPSRRLRQPQGAVRVSKAFADSFGLVALFDTAQGIELISGAFSSARTSSLAVGRVGRVADFSGSANQQFAHRAAYAQTGPLTLFAYVEYDAFSNFGPIISKQATPTSYAPYEWRTNRVGSGSPHLLIRASAGDYAGKYAASDFFASATGAPVIVGVTSNETNATAFGYGDGVYAAMDQVQNNTSVTAADNEATVWIGRRSDTATQLDGRIYYVGLCNRQLQKQFFDELRTYPWSVYTRDIRRLYFGAGTGGGGSTEYPYTGSGTLVFSGTPAYNRLIKTITAGGITYAGTATNKNEHKVAPSGGLTYAGAATAKKLFAPLVSGGISFTGDAVEKLIRAALVAGGLTFGGVAGFTPVLSGGTIYTVTPTGGITFGNSAAVKAIHQALATGGLAYSGQAGYNLIREIIAAGGLSFAGAATVSGPVTSGTGTLDQATIDAIALAVWQRIIDAGLTAEELLRLIVAHAAGSASGLESGSPNFKSLDGTKNRITGTYAAGTRTVTGRDAS